MYNGRIEGESNYTFECVGKRIVPCPYGCARKPPLLLAFSWFLATVHSYRETRRSAAALRTSVDDEATMHFSKLCH